MHNKMDDILLLDAVERYMKGEMSAEERTFFEEVRKNNPEVDQLVVEHTYFLNELDAHATVKAYKHALHEVESKMIDEGVISQTPLKGKARVVALWKRYKRSIAVAACIAGLVSLTLTGVMNKYNGQVDKSEITQLVDKINNTAKKVDDIKDKLNNNPQTSPKKTVPTGDFRATGFLIDGNGYIVTNAHVVKKMNAAIYVENNKGQYYNVKAVYTDNTSDLAILKIVDTSFRTITNLPYSIRKTNSDLGEQLFTLGFPRNEIVYSEGYLSAKSGNDGDSTAYQISVSVNPGNSGGPVLNKNGEIVGIITSKNSTADGVVYAAKSKNIYKLLEAAKKDDNSQNIKLPNNSNLKGLDRTQQVKKMEEYVFMVVGK